MDSKSTALAKVEASTSAVEEARRDLVRAVASTREKVRDATGLKLRRAWVPPVVAGAAGLALALWVKSRRR